MKWTDEMDASNGWMKWTDEMDKTDEMDGLDKMDGWMDGLLE